MTDESAPTTVNTDQAAYWSNAPGRKWVDWQEPLDIAFTPVNAALLERAAPRAGERVLEIGCGAGGTTLALAEKVGQGGHVLAADISAPLLARARERTPEALAQRIAYIEADAQTHAFEPGDRDLLASRFGVMFFEDPVAAFANMRRALRPGGRMCVAAWAPVEVNPWFSVPRDAAIARLGKPPAASPTAPGPMAFADIGYVLGILQKAGFVGAHGEEVSVSLEPPGLEEDVARLMSYIGPAARIMLALNGGPDDAAAIAKVVAERLVPFRVGSAIRLPATLNVFTARAS